MIEMRFTSRVRVKIDAGRSPRHQASHYLHVLDEAIDAHGFAYSRKVDQVTLSAWCPADMVWPEWLSVVRDLVKHTAPGACLSIAVDEWDPWFEASCGDKLPESDGRPMQYQMPRNYDKRLPEEM